MSQETPREFQRFIIALSLIFGFLGVFIYVFAVTRDIEIARTVLTFISGAVSAVVGYFFGSRSAEVSR